MVTVFNVSNDVAKATGDGDGVGAFGTETEKLALGRKNGSITKKDI